MNPKKQFEPSDEEKEIISSIRTHFGMDWTIIDRIGQGTNGKVYLAEKQQLLSSPERCAFKCIFVNPSQDNYNESFRKNLERETQTLKKLRGEPHIVQYEDSIILTRDDSHGYVIIIKMELMWKSIDKDKEHQWTDAEIIDLGIAICIALEKLEKHHIIHRDIKPANIFVSIDGEYKLGDFGEAKILSGTVHEMTLRGTYSYMSPEIAQRNPTADTRADIYSLGMVMYRLLNNNRGPFVNAHSPNVSYKELEEAQNRRFNKENPTEPPCNCTNSLLANAILKACKGKPEERWQSPAEFRRTLESIKNPPPIHNAQAYQTISNGSMSSNPQFIYPKNNSINKALVFAVIVLSLTLMVMFGIILWMINNSRENKKSEESSASQLTNSSITSELEYSSKLTEETDSSNDFSSSFPESIEESDYSEATIVEETSVPTEEEIRMEEIQKYLDRVDELLNKNKYTEAYALIDDAVSKFGTDDLLTSKRHEVSVTEIKNKIKDYEDSKSYANGIRYMNQTKSEWSLWEDSIDYTEKYNSLISNYRQELIDKANVSFQANDIDGAIGILEEGLDLLVKDTEIQNKINEFEDSKPVRLSDLKVTNNNYCHFLYETEHDPRGNSYTDALYMPYYSKNWISTIGYVEFYTGKKYSKFVCYIVPQEDFNTKRLGDGEGARIKIYADEKLVYTSEIITYKTERIDVEIDIKAANYLMIVIDGDYESTIYTPTLNTLLCEPVVYK